VRETKSNLPILIKGLLRPQAFPHKVDKIKLLETHISWVILTGKYAYKIKKQLNLNFLVTKTLKERIHFCKEELRLNRLHSTDLYIGITAIVGPASKPHFKEVSYPITSKDPEEVRSEIIEVAIKMHEFQQSQLMTNTLKGNMLKRESIEMLGKNLARFHLCSPYLSPKSEFGRIISIVTPAKDNLKVLSNSESLIVHTTFFKEHHIWIDKKITVLARIFKERRKLGAIRECHGDLHMGNIRVRDDNNLEPFDSLEFSPILRWIDPISEIAFLMIDLEVHKKSKYSIAFLNSWLEETGDYSGLRLLPWYSAYRSLVRAKVNTLRSCQINSNKETSKNVGVETSQLSNMSEKYIAKAKEIQNRKASALILMHGLSGSGKSYLSEKLCDQLLAVRIRSDIERQRLFGLKKVQKELGSSKARVQQNQKIFPKEVYPYSNRVSKYLFEELIPSLTKSSLMSGLTTIVDATYLKHKERLLMFYIARDFGIPFIIIKCSCCDSTAKTRISKRLKVNSDPSEADLKVRYMQKGIIDPLKDNEIPYKISFDEDTKFEYVIEQIRIKISHQNIKN